MVIEYIKKQIWLTKDEEKILLDKSNKAQMNQSEFIKTLIMNGIVKENLMKDFIKQ